MDADRRDGPLAELERDERERLLFLRQRARWPVAVLNGVCLVCLTVYVLRTAAGLAGVDVRRGALRYTSLAPLGVLFMVPVLMAAFGWSATVKRNSIICYAIAAALLLVAAALSPWLVRTLLG